MIKNSNKLIGYLNYLCIAKEKYEQIKNSNVTVDEFELDTIRKFEKGENFVTVNSIVIDKEYQNTDIIKIINNNFLKKLENYKKENVNISGINGIAVSKDGQKYFENLGFKKYKKMDDGNYIYLIEDNIIDTIKNSINKI